MSKYVLVSGDTVEFETMFGIAKVTVTTPPKGREIKGRAKISFNSKAVCLEEDEKTVLVSCTYIIPGYPTEGTGTIEIAPLEASNKSKCLVQGGKAALLQGKTFDAVMKVTLAAKNPGPPPILDTTPTYTGKGQFTTNNKKWQSK